MLRLAVTNGEKNRNPSKQSVLGNNVRNEHDNLPPPHASNQVYIKRIFFGNLGCA
jgi:hypothetical protein